MELERFEDVFQKDVLRSFADITEFKKFARLSNGLRLDEEEIKKIVKKHSSSVEEQKLQMLLKWKSKNNDATVSKIHELVKNFHQGDNPKDYASLCGGLYGIFKKRLLCPRGHVFLGEQISKLFGSRLRAIKLFQYNDENLRETKILTELSDHENVVSTIHADKLKGFPHDHIFIVMELAWTRHLRNVFDECDELKRPLNESTIFLLARQTLRALIFIHEHKVIHRDLKPENILVADDNSHLKLTDFGVSKLLTNSTRTQQSVSNVGTNGYRSPETYTKESISQKSDIFATGITFGELFSCGKHPFGDNPHQWINNIINNMNLDFSHLLISNTIQAEHLLLWMLQPIPENRPTAKQVMNDDLFTQSQSVVQIADASDSSKTITANAIIMLNKSDNHLYSYKPSTDKWNQMQEFQNDSPFSTIALDDHMYILRKKEVLRLLYSNANAEWSRAADMIEDHGYWPAATVLKGSIYVCGSDNYSCSRSAEMHKVAWNRWVGVESMNKARRSPCIISAKDHIYCFGGLDEQGNNIETAERLDEDGWKHIAPAPRGILNRASVTALGDQIYIADAEGVLCYDILENSWSQINLSEQWPFQKAVSPYTRLKILTIDEKIFLLGLTIKQQMAIYLLDPTIPTLSSLIEKDFEKFTIVDSAAVNL